MNSHLYLRLRIAAVARTLLLVAACSMAACGHSAKTVTPSALAANPSSYDGQDVTVSGTVKNTGTRQTRRGTAMTYQLCDSACINVVQFGDTNATDGSNLSVTGHFRAAFGRRRVMTNVLIVGAHMGT